MLHIWDRSSVLTGLAAVFFVVFSLWPHFAAALEEGKYSETEKVGFAFHTLAHFDPDLKKWIENTDRYQKAYPLDRIEMMRHEIHRLQWGYRNYAPDIDLLHLEFKVRVQASNYVSTSQRTGKNTHVKLDFVDLPENYFPFPLGDIWVALIVKDWDKIVNMEMDPETYADFAGKLSMAANGSVKSRNIWVTLRLRPVSVDTTAPLELDGIEMWLMLAEIGDIVLWRENHGRKEIVWNYAAPWYIPPQQENLLRLYRE